MTPNCQISKLRRRSRSSPSGWVELVSDEAPEATCLSKCVAPSGASFGVYSRCMRLSGKAATALGPRVRPEDDQGLTGRGSGCGITTRVTRQPGRWPGRFPPDGAPFRPGPSPGGCGSGHLRPRPSSPPFLSPRRLVMFATAWRLVCVPLRHVLPIGVSGDESIRPRHLRYQPLVRRETVAAGRDLAPATVLNPGAGPASPDIASSGVSEGGTALILRGWKWAGMKKCVGV